MDMLTLRVLAAQHPLAAVRVPAIHGFECAECVLDWVTMNAYRAEDVELAAPGDLPIVTCDNCGLPLEHITWTS